MQDKGAWFLVAVVGVAFMVIMFAMAFAPALLTPGIAGEIGDVGNGGGDLANESSMSPEQIQAFLVKKGSPFVGLAEKAGSTAGTEVSTAAKSFHVNPALMLGIFGAESTFGKFGRGARNLNPGNVKLKTSTAAEHGVIISGHDDENHSIFPSTAEGWKGHALTLRLFYLDEGRDTLQKIADKYLTGDKVRWVNSVRQFMNEALATKP